MECVQCFGSGKGGQDGKQPCAYCKGKKTQTCIDCGGSGRVKS